MRWDEAGVELPGQQIVWTKRNVMINRSFDVAVIGGGLGGVQAARAACEHGRRAYMCEATDWIGGQLTSQAVPPDENRWIESQGATRSYLAYRRAVREAYLRDPAASELLKEKTVFCPGSSWVSRVAHDPRLAHRLLTESLAPYVDRELLTVDLETRCVHALVRDDRILSVTVEHADGEQICIQAAFFLDATDTGELLPMTGTEYRVGAESRGETGEAHAPEEADAQDQQPITWVAALQLDEERRPMKKPDSYEFFSRCTLKGDPIFSWNAWGAHGKRLFSMFDGEVKDNPLGLWTYRRIQYPPYFTDGRREVSLLNWSQNDYIFGNVIDDPNREQNLEKARELTLSCAYWLWEQGYPVSLKADILGTEDGLAKAPYIRESRRILARKTILEEEISAEHQKVLPRLADSVGVGHYAIDIHMTTRTRTTMYAPALPFEIPMHAMIPVRMQNLLPAAKNIGATHITGGCFRLHPVEWTVGEAAGHLAAFCLERNLLPADAADRHCGEFQQVLESHGFQLHWDLPDILDEKL